MKEIKQGQIWHYQGIGTGRNIPHIITGIEKELSDGLIWVTAWSLPIQNQRIGGFTWKGPINVFTREFYRQ